MYPAFKKVINDIAPLSADAYQLLEDTVTTKVLKKEGVLLSEGNICRHIYFVETGCLKTVYNKDGKEINLNFTLPGRFTTELKSLKNEIPAEYSIMACADTIVLQIERAKLMDFYTRSHEITALGRNLLEQLLMDQEQHAHLFKTKTPKERYQQICTNEPELLQTISLTQLSSYLGISRETLSRIRK